MVNNPNSNVTRFSLIAAFGGFVFGLDAANISGAIRYVSSLFELDSIQQGTVVGCALLGVIVALFFTGSLCEKFGRAKTLLAIGFTYSLSSLISATAVNYEMLVIGRFIGGVAFASITVSAMYIGEIAPPEKRGKFVSVNQFMIGLGLLLAFVINYFLIKYIDEISWINNDNIWRYMLGAELVANALWIALLLKIPESPRWLVMQGREEEAAKVFARIAPKEQITGLIDSVKQSLHNEPKLPIKKQLKELFSGRMRFVLLIAVCYAIVQGATGMNAVLFFAPMVFEQVGMSVEDTFMQTITTGVVGLIATFIAIAFVEKLGRRFLTLAGLVLVVVAHGSTWFGFSQAKYVFDEKAVASIVVELKAENIPTESVERLLGRTFDNDVTLKTKLSEMYNKKELPIVSGVIIHNSVVGINAPLVLFGIFAFLAAFNLSIGPIMWVIFSEVFPNSVRSVALPFAALVQTISSWSIQQFFPWQLDNMGVASIFFIYATLGLVGLIVMWFILPETKGKSIEDIERQLVRS
ncbi:MFS transporter [Paraglaciecola sp. L3A3]|uniref:MFS transporter n=1 Tax=Paraglaciecola sp. L3A3 TaxID=2686358 RepID=UPI00131BFC38|nr:MFS transporter [Paraglaciecola sp. L3A3]